MIVLKLILLALFILAAIPVIAHAIGRIYALDRRADVTHHVPTDDGWTLALHEYRPDPAAAAQPIPVLFCHGLAGNRLGFDFDDGYSIARHLTARGFRVFLLELRGSGESETPIFYDERRFSWTFDTHVDHDAPAAIDAVLKITGAKSCHWVGHSMGGMVGYASVQGRAGKFLESMVLIGSPGAFTHVEKVVALRGVVGHLRGIYVRQFSQLLTLFVEHVETFQRWSGNWNLRRGDYARSFANLQSNPSTPLLLQLSTFAEKGSVCSLDGRDYLAGLAKIEIPVLGIAGAHDFTVPPDSVRRAVDSFGSPNKELRVMGPDQGHRGRYGHMTLLFGKDAPAEVYPILTEWLEGGYRPKRKSRKKAA